MSRVAAFFAVLSPVSNQPSGYTELLADCLHRGEDPEITPDFAHWMGEPRCPRRKAGQVRLPEGFDAGRTRGWL